MCVPIATYSIWNKCSVGRATISDCTSACNFSMMGESNDATRQANVPTITLLLAWKATKSKIANYTVDLKSKSKIANLITKETPADIFRSFHIKSTKAGLVTSWIWLIFG